MQTVCVFCGSSSGGDPVYTEAARSLGAALVTRRLNLVYGGGHVGLMGIIADAVLTGGGKVVGVINRALVEKELAHRGLTELCVVETMHQRKALMADLSDAFIALPGGYGTLDETFEILTWAQLGLHSKPIGMLNVAGFFDPLLGWIHQAVAAGFVRLQHCSLLNVATNHEELLDVLTRHEPALPLPKWLGPDNR
jgi:hypothetical protein